MVFCSKASLILYLSLHLYVLMTLTCGPDDAKSAVLGKCCSFSLPFLFVYCYFNNVINERSNDLLFAVLVRNRNSL